MTDKEQIERISKLLNELSLDDITSTEFDEMFPKQSINDIKDELWRMYCFASDVCDTINMGDTAEQELTGWISVSERLPETDDDVLVCDGVDMFVAWYSWKGMWQGWNSHDNSFERDTPIIAWMPLPPSYQGK